MSKKKDSDNPVHSLFIADPNMVRFFRDSQQHLFQHKDRLANFTAPTLDADGALELRATMTTIFPDQEIVALFQPAQVQALRLYLESTNRLYMESKSQMSLQDLVFFQLAIILMRLASDYINACDLFELHKDGFRKAYPRVLEFNAITNAVSWEKVRKQMEQVLEDAFRQRYEEMAMTHTTFYSDSRLANEALTIGMFLADQNKTQPDIPNGLAFEQECEGLLKEAGYVVERTSISGDFGIDLVARRNGLTYAIQCKYYGTPVGVSAVQEATAGRLHYLADCAVVVARSGFTMQARRLAESNSVLLIGSSQLAGLQDLAHALL